MNSITIVPAPSFGAALNEFMKHYGLTGYRIAKATNISSSAISRWRKGDRHPTRENILDVLDTFYADERWSAYLLASAGYLPQGWFITNERPEIPS